MVELRAEAVSRCLAPVVQVIKPGRKPERRRGMGDVDRPDQADGSGPAISASVRPSVMTISPLARPRWSTRPGPARPCSEVGGERDKPRRNGLDHRLASELIRAGQAQHRSRCLLAIGVALSAPARPGPRLRPPRLVRRAALRRAVAVRRSTGWHRGCGREHDGGGGGQAGGREAEGRPDGRDDEATERRTGAGAETP